VGDPHHSFLKNNFFSITRLSVIEFSVTTDPGGAINSRTSRWWRPDLIYHMIVWFDTIPVGWSKGKKNRDRGTRKRNRSRYKSFAAFPRFPLCLKWIAPPCVLRPSHFMLLAHGPNCVGYDTASSPGFSLSPG
jgi:hypothetical protein